MGDNIRLIAFTHYKYSGQLFFIKNVLGINIEQCKVLFYVPFSSLFPFLGPLLYLSLCQCCLSSFLSFYWPSTPQKCTVFRQVSLPVLFLSCLHLPSPRLTGPRYGVCWKVHVIRNYFLLGVAHCTLNSALKPYVDFLKMFFSHCLDFKI